MEGTIPRQVAAGRYVLQLGDPLGAVIREGTRAERAHIRPRPTPIHCRPKLIRGLLGGQSEVAAALSALDAGLPIEVSGESGIGKTALLRHLAYHARAAAFADGIVYLSARHQSADDLLQLLFEVFNDSEEACKPTDAEIRKGLQEKQAFILLDDVQLKQDELEHVLDIAPQSAFAVATCERCLWGEVRSLVLKGLPVDAALPLLERELERPLDADERPAGASLCEAVGGHPLRIVQAAAIVREQSLSLQTSQPDTTPDGLITELLASIDDKQRRALLVLTAMPGVPLQTQHVAGIAETTDIEPALMALLRRGLVVGSQSRHQLADGVADRLRRSDDLKPWANRAITYFTAWAERHRRNPDVLLEESETLLRVQHAAANARRWGEVLLLGRILEDALIGGARWGAWAASLDLTVSAARSTGDRSSEARALHQMGTRALCAGDAGKARALLGQAVKLRETLQEDAAAEVSRRNLRLVFSSAAEEPREPSPAPPPVAAPAAVAPRVIEAMPLHATVPPSASPVRTAGVGMLALTLLLFVILGWFGYWTLASRLSGSATPRADQPPPVLAAQTQHAQAESPPVPRLYSDMSLPAADPTPVAPAAQGSAPATEGVGIRIFTARPGSIATSGRAGLCYAVDGAVQVRIDPGVGEVSPASTLTCLRVAPPRTTTYELTASGRDGRQVRQQLVIVVR